MHEQDRPKACVLQERTCIACGECDRCDLDPDKLCDNCKRCITSDEAYRVLRIDAVVLDEDSVDN